DLKAINDPFVPAFVVVGIVRPAKLLAKRFSRVPAIDREGQRPGIAQVAIIPEMDGDARQYSHTLPEPTFVPEKRAVHDVYRQRTDVFTFVDIVAADDRNLCQTGCAEFSDKSGIQRRFAEMACPIGIAGIT